MARDGLQSQRFQVDLTSAGLLRPDLSLPAYAGLLPRDGRSPIFNLFDRTRGGAHYSQRVSRRRQRDYRGGRLSYDEHDGTDFVCPIGTPLVAAASGHVVMVRDRWLRGGLTVALDHGGGVVTHYTHCSRALVEVGQPVARGTPVALSGVSGADMTLFFPWVPPHVHFMVWRDGCPHDPFRAHGEPDRSGSWTHRNAPVPASPDAIEPVPERSPVSEVALEFAIASCTDSDIRCELEAALAHGPAAAAALAEDALQHDAGAFTDDRPMSVRPPPVRRREVRLSLPLPATLYRGASFADSRRTLPPAS